MRLTCARSATLQPGRTFDWCATLVPGLLNEHCGEQMAAYIEGSYQQEASKGGELLGTGRAYIYKSIASVATYTVLLQVFSTPIPHGSLPAAPGR
jgi:hypothetical protein